MTHDPITNATLQSLRDVMQRQNTVLRDLVDVLRDVRDELVIARLQREQDNRVRQSALDNGAGEHP